MAINIEFSLQVEDPTGSNHWIDYPGGITRLTGESGHYRIYYSFSASQGGTFEGMTFDVTFPDVYENLRNVSGVGLPSEATYTMVQDGDGLRMQITFAPGLSPGQSGFMEFFVNSFAPAGPDDYLIPSTIALSGSFLSMGGVETPIAETKPGPNWTVACDLYDRLTKSVVNNGTIYVEDADAYIVDYRVNRWLAPPVPGSNNGVWKAEKCTLVEYLPTITGVIPVMVWSDRNFIQSGNTVTWDYSPYVTPSNVVSINFRLRYPKAEVDAQGGPSAIGDITNQVSALYKLVGDVERTIPAQVVHPLLPIPSPTQGNVSLEKASTPTSISGTMLGLQDINVLFRLQATQQSGNMIPRTIEITDLRLTIELEGGTIYQPGPDEIEWKEIQIMNDTVLFEYQTALGGGVWVPDPTITGPRHYFPVVPPGDYITSFRFTGSSFMRPGDTLLSYVWLTVKLRSPALEKYEHITNEMQARITLSNGSVITGNAQVVIPVDYAQTIITRIISTAADDLTVNPGGTATVRASMGIAQGTTTMVSGTDLFVVIPQGFDLTAVLEGTRVLDPLEYIVTQNWQVPGQTLLRVPIKYSALSKEGDSFGYSLRCDVDPLIVPGAHPFDFWYVLNSAQANAPDITHSAIGTRAPDIYDFDEDGDREELVAMQTLQVTVTSAHVVNVIKLSKSVRDSDFHPDNDTHVTPNEMFQYRLTVRNDSPDPMTDLVMIDIFPYLGDMFSSQWRPLLYGPVTPPANVEVKYSLSADPIMAPIGPGGTGAWLNSPPADMETVRAVRLDFGDRVFMPGESATVIFDMMGPEGTPVDTTCYNNVNYIASAIIEGRHVPYLPAYSPPAYARVTMTLGENAIGDYVWWDRNGNGIQDSGEPGLNGVTVELYDDQETLLRTTVSANHPQSGRPGYYLFEGLLDGSYTVWFDPAPFEETSLTIQHAGSDPNRDSDPDPVTGFTEAIPLADAAIRTDIDAGYLMPVPCQEELCQAVTDLIESVALEQAALSHILNAEGEKLQAFLARSDEEPASLLKANLSVKKMVDAVTLLEMVLEGKIGLTQQRQS